MLFRQPQLATPSLQSTGYQLTLSPVWSPRPEYSSHPTPNFLLSSHLNSPVPDLPRAFTLPELLSLFIWLYSICCLIFYQLTWEERPRLRKCLHLIGLWASGGWEHYVWMLQPLSRWSWDVSKEQAIETSQQTVCLPVSASVPSLVWVSAGASLKDALWSGVVSWNSAFLPKLLLVVVFTTTTGNKLGHSASPTRVWTPSDQGYFCIHFLSSLV